MLLLIGFLLLLVLVIALSSRKTEKYDPVSTRYANLQEYDFGNQVFDMEADAVGLYPEWAYESEDF